MAHVPYQQRAEWLLQLHGVLSLMGDAVGSPPFLILRIDADGAFFRNPAETLDQLLNTIRVV